MKKTLFFLMSLCALTISSCMKEENPEISGETYTYTFNGTAGPETKVSVGDKTEEGWPIKWTGGDVISVFKTSDSEQLGSAKLDPESTGKTHGTFTMTTDVSHEGEVLIAHGSSLTYADGTISAAVPAEQEYISAGNSTHIGKSGLAYAKAVMSGADVPVEFVLEHKSAFVRLVLKTSEFSEHILTGATLWCKGTHLAGTLSADVTDGMVTAEGSDDYVKVSFREENLEAFGSEAELWFSTLPVDLTGKDLYVIVHMTKGTATVTVPVKIPGGNLQSGAVNTITIKDLKTSSAPAWYETVETRYIAAYGESWSYGPANTVLATVKGDAETVEFKARGNFRYVTEPKYIQFKYGHDLNDSNKKATYIDGSACYGTDSYTEFELDENYSVDIQVGKSGSYPGYMAVMYLKDAEKNVIWGTNVWAVSELNEIVYTNGAILDRNLGSGYKGDANENKAGLVAFQWGRPFAFGYGKTMVTAADIVACDAVTSLGVQSANPYTFYKYLDVKYTSGSGVNDWWYGNGSSDASNHINDLWGNETSSGSGVKSNYDPCPKGYRVASPEILNEVMQTSSIVTTNTKCYYLSYNNDCWAFNYIRLGEKGNRSTPGIDTVAYWSNGVNGTNGYCMIARYASGALGEFTTSTGRANGLAVRCMKDTENR